MKKELDALLCSRYPLIFADRHAPMTQSCMYWGFSCGDGWFDLIDTLCARLQFATDHNKAPQVVATQVKEILQNPERSLLEARKSWHPPRHEAKQP